MATTAIRTLTPGHVGLPDRYCGSPVCGRPECRAWQEGWSAGVDDMLKRFALLVPAAAKLLSVRSRMNMRALNTPRMVEEREGAEAMI